MYNYSYLRIVYHIVVLKHTMKKEAERRELVPCNMGNLTCVATDGFLHGKSIGAASTHCAIYWWFTALISLYILNTCVCVCV